MALKFSFFYDILCPRSWIFYQVLQKKLPKWRTYREFDIEYLPVSSLFIHEKIYGIHPAGIITRKKDYMLQELQEICDFYGLEKGNFEVTYGLNNRRSKSCLMLLNYIRRKMPQYYHMFLERMWHDFWISSASFSHTAHFFKIGRELGVPFKEMNNLIMHIEQPENSLDIGARNMHLIFDERIIDIPWFRIDSVPGNEKLFAFTEILRLELMDELMAQTCFNPLNHNVGHSLCHPPPTEEETTKIAEKEEMNAFGGDNITSKIEKFWRKKSRSQIKYI